MNKRIKESFRETKAYFCLECGKCTSICPVSLHDSSFSPRLMVKRALLDFEEDLLSDGNIWECLTCNLCNDVCMSDVKIPEFIRTVREQGLAVDNFGKPSHCEMPHAISRLMAKTQLKQNRLGWLTEDMKVRHDEGEYLLWTGCTPYFRSIFSEFDEATDVPRAAVRLLNFLGIEPVLLPDEKCCGHDMLWVGRNDVFESLRQQNTARIENAKVDKIITLCAEGYMTLRNDYRLDAEVMHISQFLADRIDNNDIQFKDMSWGKITYHDPCRLGRFAGEYEAPRKVLENLPGVELVEMHRNRHKSPCCGVSAWMNCDEFSRQMRLNKLSMAQETDAGILATACPKCRIHLRCYTTNEHVEPQIKMQVEDITVLAAQSLGLDGDRRSKK